MLIGCRPPDLHYCRRFSLNQKWLCAGICILAILMNCHLVVGSFYPWSCHCRISIINSIKVLNKIETTKQYGIYFSDIQSFMSDYNVSSTKA